MQLCSCRDGARTRFFEVTDQRQEKIPRPRTEFSSTSALEKRLKPERNRKQILQLFGWSVVYFRKFRSRIGAGVQFINLYCTNQYFCLIFLPFLFSLFRFEICWSEVLPKSLGVGLKPKLLCKKNGVERSRKFATLLHSFVHSRSRTKKLESKNVLKDPMSPSLCI